MSYSSIAAMAYNGPLKDRITACAASLGHASPKAFTEAEIWRVVAAPGWAQAWDAAVAQQGPDKPDPGADPAVVTDEMIRTAVEPLVPAD